MSEHEQARKLVRETRDFWRGHATTETRATKLADALGAALDREERLREALKEMHEFQCGCDKPGDSRVCVATPVYSFSILSTREQG